MVVEPLTIICPGAFTTPVVKEIIDEYALQVFEPSGSIA